MRRQENVGERKLHIARGFRRRVYAWMCVVGLGILVCGTSTLAWYTLRSMTVSAEGNVVKPYYLGLQNPSDTATLQLSVGSLLQGRTKQIVFCVSSEETQMPNPFATTFDYWLEVVHTDNLALDYKIYPLTEVADPEGDDTEKLITSEDVVEVKGENGVVTGTKTITKYWQKTTDTALVGQDLSAVRQVQAGLTLNADGTESQTSVEDIVNKGTYTAYGYRQGISEEGKVDAAAEGVDGGAGDDLNETDVINYFQLEVGNNAAPENQNRYFLVEISWNITSGFDKYDKETDMIYLLAKAREPKPALLGN